MDDDHCAAGGGFFRYHSKELLEQMLANEGDDPSHMYDGQDITDEEANRSVLGGQFLLAQFGIYHNIRHGCFQYWDSPRVFHGTCRSQVLPGYAQIGSTMQITNALVRRVARNNACN